MMMAAAAMAMMAGIGPIYLKSPGTGDSKWSWYLFVENIHSYIKKMMQKNMHLLSEEAMRRQHNGILRRVSLAVIKEKK